MTTHHEGSTHIRRIHPAADEGSSATTDAPRPLPAGHVERHRRELETKLGRPVSSLVARADLLSSARASDEHVLIARDRYEELCRRSSVDGKTGLHNYRAFAERLHGEVGRAQRHGEQLALIMVDIDGLKHLNDRCGHLEGDRAIIALATVLARESRAGDVCARYGGDEFAVIVTHVDEAGGAQLAQRLLAASREPLARFGVGISLGVAGWPESADSCEQLVAAADEALYFAKRAGGNRVRVFTSRRESIPA